MRFVSPTIVENHHANVKEKGVTNKHTCRWKEGKIDWYLKEKKERKMKKVGISGVKEER